MNTANKRKQQVKQAIIRLVILAAILVCVNIIAARFHADIDLTKEKRFTLSGATKKLLREMKEVAVIDVYMKGAFPAGIERLKQAVQERLESFRGYGGQNIMVHFIDPLEGKSGKEKEIAMEQMSQKGINPMRLNVKNSDEGMSEKIIFPYALVKFNGKEKAVNLLEKHAGWDQWQMLSYSETILEYKFASAIRDMTLADKPSIAYIMGHNEALGVETIDALNTLPNYYHVDTIDLAHSLRIPISYDAIIINKPTSLFDDKEKFKIDQYVMRGGHVLWLIDMLKTPMDSLRLHGQFITTDYGLNLDDILFRYGVRVNTDLVEDLSAVSFPLLASKNLSQNDIQYYKWIYFPVFNATSRHPIVKNLPPVLSKFANSIDTVADPDIHKTVLLESSKYSRVSASPARVSLSFAAFTPQPEMFNMPYRPVAVLLEGKFRSVFANRIAASFSNILDSLKQPFKASCDSPTSMIVVSDGDIMTNDYFANRGPMEMGYWDFPQDMFANKSFILNCLEYLTDRSGLIEARSKELNIRLLDKGRLNKEKIQWRVVNIGIPVALVVIFSSVYFFFRKRRYEKKAA